MVKMVEIRIDQDQVFALGPVDQFRKVQPQPDAHGNGKMPLRIAEMFFKHDTGLGGAGVQPIGKVPFLPILYFVLYKIGFNPVCSLPIPAQRLSV